MNPNGFILEVPAELRKTTQKDIIMVSIKSYYKRKVKRTTEKDTISYQAGKHRILPSPQLDMRFAPGVR